MHDHKELKLKNLGIDTYRENIIYMRSDCFVCKSEGFTALTRIFVKIRNISIVATLNVVYSDLLLPGEAGLSLEAMRRLSAREGDSLTVSHLPPIPSLKFVRSKMYGKELNATELQQIIKDITHGYYSNIELAAFLASSAGNNLSTQEICSLTRAMMSTGKKLNWNGQPIYDKHCIGGLPGNRTTPIVVSIVAAAGLTIPKTSSRAITSPAGTADTMQVMTNVDLTLDEMRSVVNKENGCLVWGGSVSLSPADDILISVEKALDVDSEGQMIASVLSKKVAAGSTHVVIDIPVGKTAKVRTEIEANALKDRFQIIAEELGIKVAALISDGSQPVGRGIGPSLEAIDVLSVLRNDFNAPEDLKIRSVYIAGQLLEISGISDKDKGIDKANQLLSSGSAYHKFISICEAQGRFSEPVLAKHMACVNAKHGGIVQEIDCRKLAKVAKLAGAPRSLLAGVEFLSPLQKQISKGEELFRVYAESGGELDYALEYYKSQDEMIRIA